MWRTVVSQPLALHSSGCHPNIDKEDCVMLDLQKNVANGGVPATCASLQWLPPEHRQRRLRDAGFTQKMWRTAVSQPLALRSSGCHPNIDKEDCVMRDLQGMQRTGMAMW
jgi:hypothetical protein